MMYVLIDTILIFSLTMMYTKIIPRYCILLIVIILIIKNLKLIIDKIKNIEGD